MTETKNLSFNEMAQINAVGSCGSAYFWWGISTVGMLASAAGSFAGVGLISMGVSVVGWYGSFYNLLYACG